MWSLFAACAFFVGIHVFISGSPLRRVLVGAIGEGPYLGLFSLLSVAGMTWLVIAYRQAPRLILWSPPAALRWAAPALLLIAALFVVGGLTTPSPTATGGEKTLDRDDAAQGMLRITRHPFLWGVALWAVLHVALNGDVASLLLFSSLLLLALVGPLLIDAKRRRAFGPKWARFANRTSNLPFAAILAGRNTLQLAEVGVWRSLLAIAVWVLIVVLHPWLFGVSALPVM